MKKATLILILAFAVGSGCSTLKKAKDKITVDDVKKVSDLINMDFGKGPDGPFQVTNSTSKSPLLVIQNDTDRTITVKAVGSVTKTFVIKTKQNSSSNVDAGKYHFVATAPETNGCEGDVELGSFKQYKWIFYIKK